MSDIKFPLGIAKGYQFCNRTSETKLLIQNIKKARHTVLIAPRRYGKTSLAYRAISKVDIPNAKADLYMSTSSRSIELEIMAAINKIISNISNSGDKLVAIAKDYLKSLKISYEISPDKGPSIKLEPKGDALAQHTLKDSLFVLERILEDKNKSAVLLIDEFQEIERIASAQGIEGAIRHVIQESNRLCVIFSGSHRRMLKSMFNDRNKPLYRLCDEITLDRIHSSDYHPFIHKLALKKWNKPIDNASIDKILNLSKQHPYYVNIICDKLFDRNNPPTPTDVQDTWNSLVDNKNSIFKELGANLTLAEKKVLVAIAHGHNSNLTSKDFLSWTNLAASTTSNAIKFLMHNDYIELNNTNYRIIDPLFEDILKKCQAF